MATPPLPITQTNDLMLNMETPKFTSLEGDRKLWFSMWFLGSIVTFGVAFFPMFYRLMKGRNDHFEKEEALEQQVAAYLQSKGKPAPAVTKHPKEMNAKAWAASIILIIPAFIIVYLLSRDLLTHEVEQDQFLAQAFPERMFMQQTIPIKTYAIITVLTLGFGVIYWLYKVVNLYNSHYKAHLQVEKKILSLMEENINGEHSM